MVTSPLYQLYRCEHCLIWSFALSHFPGILSFSFPNASFPFSLFSSYPILFISYPLNPSISIHVQLSSFPSLHFPCSLFPYPPPPLFWFPFAVPFFLFPLSLSSIFLHFFLDRKDQTVVIFLRKHIVFFFFQEFCVFAMVCLLSDFFLQMVLFVTVLSIDIRRMEVLSDKYSSKG